MSEMKTKDVNRRRCASIVCIVMSMMSKRAKNDKRPPIRNIDGKKWKTVRDKPKATNANRSVAHHAVRAKVLYKGKIMTLGEAIKLEAGDKIKQKVKSKDIALGFLESESGRELYSSVSKIADVVIPPLEEFPVDFKNWEKHGYEEIHDIFESKVFVGDKMEDEGDVKEDVDDEPEAKDPDQPDEPDEPDEPKKEVAQTQQVEVEEVVDDVKEELPEQETLEDLLNVPEVIDRVSDIMRDRVSVEMQAIEDAISRSRDVERIEPFIRAQERERLEFEQRIIEIENRVRFRIASEQEAKEEKGTFELHIPGFNYAGPGTRIAENIRNNVEPFNAVDAIARQHDIDYVSANTEQDIREADLRMMRALQELPAGMTGNLIAQGAIGAKMRLEDAGLIPITQFTSVNKVSDDEVKQAERELGVFPTRMRNNLDAILNSVSPEEADIIRRDVNQAQEALMEIDDDLRQDRDFGLRPDFVDGDPDAPVAPVDPVDPVAPVVPVVPDPTVLLPSDPEKPLLRPTFVTASAEPLEKSEEQLKNDVSEWVQFDFHQDDHTNPLNERSRLKGARNYTQGQGILVQEPETESLKSLSMKSFDEEIPLRDQVQSEPFMVTNPWIVPQGPKKCSLPSGLSPLWLRNDLPVQNNHDLFNRRLLNNALYFKRF